MLRLLLQLLLQPPPRLSQRVTQRVTMGCGPSNIINPRKWRSRARSNHSGSDVGSDEDADDAAPVPRRGVGADADDENSALLVVVGAAGEASGSGAGAGAAGEPDDEPARAAAARLRQLAQNAPGPQLPHTYAPHIEVSASQTDFFRILDMKVESGPELEPDSESERLREEARLRCLVREWERCRQERAHRDVRDREQLGPDLQRGGNASDSSAASASPRHYHDAVARAGAAGARVKPEHAVHAVPSQGAALACSTTSSSVRGAAGARPPQHPSQYPSNTTTTSHDAAWRRANLAWVPEQRPVGVPPSGPMAGLQSLYGQPYPGPGRPVAAWTHNLYQGYDTVGTWYTASPSSVASASASVTSVGFRPYRQQSDASQSGQWPEVGSGSARMDYDDALLYHGQGLGQGPEGLGHDPYFSQQPYTAAAYQGLGQRYGHGSGPGLGLGGAMGAGRHPDQHAANSMVQLDKSGGTRTELA